jgi:hypothetical protein
MPESVNGAFLGYQLCVGCGTAVATELARITGGRCGPCLRDHHADVLHEIEVLVDGARSTVKVDRKPKTGSRGSRDTRYKAELAKRRALRRLRYVAPELYAVFLASERDKLGLDPFPLSSAVRTAGPADRPVRTMGPGDSYDQGDGVEDGDPAGGAAATGR